MTVLHLIDSLATGGAERQLLEMAKGLSGRSDVTTTIVVLSDHIPPTARQALREVKVVTLPRRTRKDFRVAFQFIRLCRQVRPDVIVAWEPMCAVYALPAAKTCRAKLVNAMIRNAPARIHPLSSTGLRRSLTFPFSDAIVGNSAAGLRAYGVRRGGHVIYNGFDLTRTHRCEPQGAVRDRHDIRRPRVVGMVASFTEKKDQATFLRAARQVADRRHDVAFILVGDGARRVQCQRLAADIPNADIRFLGQQSDVEGIVNCFDVGVLATFTEGMSNSIMEYMALGKPVVATDGGGTAEVVVHGETGFLVGREDADGLAERILELLADPDRARQMGEAGRRRIETEFSLERMVTNHLALYRSLLT